MNKENSLTVSKIIGPPLPPKKDSSLNLKESYIKFKVKFNLEQRLKEFKKIQDKFQKKIPIIVEKAEGKSNITELEKHKFLIDKDANMGQFIYMIRKQLKLKPEEALFIFINN